MEKLSKWLTIKEAMAYLRVSQRTIRNYVDQEKLTEYRDPLGGGMVRFLRSDVENFFRPKSKSYKKKAGNEPD